MTVHDALCGADVGDVTGATPGGVLYRYGTPEPGC
jgi:hypothetical protein